MKSQLALPRLGRTKIIQKGEPIIQGWSLIPASRMAPAQTFPSELTTLRSNDEGDMVKTCPLNTKAKETLYLEGAKSQQR